MPVDLIPLDTPVASLNFTVGWQPGEHLMLDKCELGESATSVDARQTCVPGAADVSVILVDSGQQPIKVIPRGSVSELLFKVAPDTAGKPVEVCIDPESVVFGDTAGSETCKAPPLCGQVEIDPLCNRQGDCNCDGKVNSGDRVCLISKFFDPGLRGGCDCEDCNLSGTLNSADAPCITLCAFNQCPPTGRRMP